MLLTSTLYAVCETGQRNGAFDVERKQRTGVQELKARIADATGLLESRIQMMHTAL